MRLPEKHSLLRYLLSLGLALALLGGCSRFESPPSGARVACDPRLVGEWFTGEWAQQGAQEPNAKDEDLDYFRIQAKTCALIGRKTGARPSDILGYSVTYLPNAQGGYLIATNGKHGAPAGWSERDDQASAQMAESQRDAGMPPSVHMIYRYTVSADRIAIHQIDPLRMARLILGKSTRGSIDGEDGKITTAKQLDGLLAKAKADGDELAFNTYVPGTSAQVDALLAAHQDLFFAKPMGILRRVKPAGPAAVPAAKAAPRR